MDPKANMAEQLKLAVAIQKNVEARDAAPLARTFEECEARQAAAIDLINDAERLAELVLALAGWQGKQGLPGWSAGGKQYD